MPVRTLVKLAGLAIAIVFANLVANWLADQLNLDVRPSNEDILHRTIMAAAVVYALLIAVPFVPGVEIGLSMIAIFGPRIAMLVYLCTVAGLSTSFLVGRLLPLRGLVALLQDLRLLRLSGLFGQLAPMNMEQRLAFLTSRAPNRLVPFLLRHRYLALAVALNMPGNIVAGGGGGLSLFAGASGLYGTIGSLLTIALAVLPVPLAVALLGPQILPD